MLLMGCAAQAQLHDSISVTKNTYYQNSYSDLELNPLFSSGLKLNNFTQTQVDYQTKQLNFKRVQTAEKINNYRFSSRGVYNYDSKTRVFGSFDFVKQEEEGLGFNFSSQRTEDQMVLAPNYFYAPKKGNWDNQYYNIKGGFAYTFDNNISIGAVINYKNGKNYRKIDPRPQITQHKIGGVGFIGYKFRNHSLILNGGLERERETSDITYVDKYQNAPVYEETYTKFSTGYGRILFNPSYTKYLQQGLDKKSGIGYQYQDKKQLFNVSYAYSHYLNDFYVKDGNSEVFFDSKNIAYKYRILSHEVVGSYKYDGEQLDLKADLGFKTSQTDNFSVIENGQNYRGTTDQLTFNAGVIKNRGDKTLYAIEMGAVYSENKFIDLLAYANKSVNYLDVHASVNADVLHNAKNKINIKLVLSNYVALKENLIFSSTTSNTTFAERVIFQDHAFDVTTKMAASAHVNYDVKLNKNKNLRLFADYQTLMATGHQYETYYKDLNTKVNQNINFGIAIIY